MQDLLPTDVLAWAFCLTQLAYATAFGVDAWLVSRPADFVDPEEVNTLDRNELPYIVLFYPVLRELEATMRTTFLSLSRLDYPQSRYSVVAIPNANDLETVASLRRLQSEFDFLEVVEVPPTSDPTWQAVWDGWDRTEKTYWWHRGPRAGVRDLPPKKTRQLIYAFYNVAKVREGGEDFLVNYIDADSCPPADHFIVAAAGIRHFDVLQAQNIAGNLNASMAASFHAFDHMAWDGVKHPHLTAGGKQPFWVLGKGLFFRASDLVELGGFNPWLTIEDPEVGMRFWTNGKRLGIIENPLVEEVPMTFAHGITQRKRWVAGFFQSLGAPLREMGMRPLDRFKAWLNFMPCLSLTLNATGIPIGIWAFIAWRAGHDSWPAWASWLAAANIAALATTMGYLYLRTWQRSRLVLPRRRDRALYLLRVNPVFLMAWWMMWLVPLFIGFKMYLQDGGLVWERTEKTDANHKLVRHVVGATPPGNVVPIHPAGQETLPDNVIPFNARAS